MTPLLRLTAGAGAGIIAMSATYPLDMIRGRLTIQEGRGKAAAYRGITHATLSVVREVQHPDPCLASVFMRAMHFHGCQAVVLPSIHSLNPSSMCHRLSARSAFEQDAQPVTAHEQTVQ